MTAIELKKYIFEKDKIRFILEQIGCKQIEYHENKNYYSCTNAIGGDCNNPSAINVFNNEYLNYINYTRGVSYDEHKDIISLVQYNKSFDFVKAIKYIHKILGLKYSYHKDTKEEKQEDKKDFMSNFFEKYKSHRTRCNVLEFEPLDESILNDFIPHIHVDLYKEGIMPKTIKKFGLGYSYKWKRTIFPVRYWLDGSLMGYNARTSVENYEEFDIKKYFITPGMKKEINLYGLYENYEDILSAKYCTVFEAEKSVLKRDSRFDSTGVALQGHTISNEQVQILLGLDIYEIVIAMDKDVPIQDVWNMCEKFYRSKKVSYIYDKWGILKEKDSPADANNKLYKFLFKYRVTYDEKKHNEYLKELEKK